MLLYIFTAVHKFLSRYDSVLIGIHLLENHVYMPIDHSLNSLPIMQHFVNCGYYDQHFLSRDVTIPVQVVEPNERRERLESKNRSARI